MIISIFLRRSPTKFPRFPTKFPDFPTKFPDFPTKFPEPGKGVSY